MFGIKTLKKKAGSTLVETIVAVVVLALGITGATRLVLTSMQISNTSSAKYTAINIAKSRFEQMKMAGIDNLSLWVVSNEVCDAQGIPTSRGDYKVTVEVTRVQTNLADVVISVYDRNRMTREFDGNPEVIETRMR